MEVSKLQEHLKKLPNLTNASVIQLTVVTPSVGVQIFDGEWVKDLYEALVLKNEESR